MAKNRGKLPRKAMFNHRGKKKVFTLYKPYEKFDANSPIISDKLSFLRQNKIVKLNYFTDEKGKELVDFYIKSHESPILVQTKDALLIIRQYQDELNKLKQLEKLSENAWKYKKDSDIAMKYNEKVNELKQLIIMLIKRVKDTID
ncbi:MAG: hypothetical protein ACFFG0_18155 [Candidatus Thorarchaeota archaeon]